MAKVKAVPRKREGSKAVPAVSGVRVQRARRRNYEYDHHYGLQVGVAGMARRAGVSGGTSRSPSKVAKPKRPAKKR